ncbi:MAG TPA: hypothetical protein PKA27_02680 [Fimbriimonadaceae bacterium]|nr:hypothetical protein [Fimbriimonadaceae bacterium]
MWFEPVLAGNLLRMAESEFGWIRHALQVARDNGCTELELEYDDVKFEAKLMPISSPVAHHAVEPSGDSVTESDDTAPIKATAVGFFRRADALFVGAHIKKGDVIGSIIALGLASEVESKVSGEVVEVSVEDDSPVQYGQEIGRVKVSS